MNSLSWFIYLTQIVDNLQGASQGILIAGAFAGLMGIVFGPTTGDMSDMEVPFRKIIKWYAGIMLVAMSAYVFTPTRQTMIMIAGSEMGERLVKSDSVNSIVNPGMDLIRKWIKQEADKIKDKS